MNCLSFIEPPPAAPPPSGPRAAPVGEVLLTDRASAAYSLETPVEPRSSMAPIPGSSQRGT